ncbi:MAG: right-handed parallel beta-helix repeat-containing protein [Phycisphaerales bacterium]
MQRVLSTASFVGVLASLAASASASVIHVPATQPTLKAAIAAATSGDEIVVADGTYSGPDNRGLDFGGKNLFLHSANGPSACIIDCELANRAFSFQSGETEAAIVEGFTILNGKPAAGNGGAILVNGVEIATRPTVRDCVFNNNSAPNGGAMAISGNADPDVVDCTFVASKAIVSGSNGFGGAISLSGASAAATITGCMFDSNTSGGGAGIHAQSSSKPTVDRCTFVKNSSSAAGGGMTLGGGANSSVSNCGFFGNIAGAGGGGGIVCAGSASNATIVNCVFSGNKALSFGLGGGVYVTSGTTKLLNCTLAGNTVEAVNLGGALAKLNGATCMAYNCILWGNTGQQIQSPGTPTIVVEYSNVQGGFAGVGNSAADPLFVDLDGADNVVGTVDDDFHVVGFSSAIDSGSNSAWSVALTVDFAGLPRFYDDPAVSNSGEGSSPIIDRGAYESQPQRPACALGDLDCDGDVDAADLGLLLGAWGTNNEDADLDDDGIVAAGDLGILLGAWTG